MAEIPNWLVGRHVTGLNINLYQIDATGKLTPISGYTDESLLCTVDEIDIEVRVEPAQVAPMDSAAMSDVPVSMGYAMSLVEILRNGKRNSLARIGYACGQSNDYMVLSITFVRGSQTWVANFFFGGYREGIRRGKSVGVLTLNPVAVTNIPYGNPAFVAPGQPVSYTSSVPGDS